MRVILPEEREWREMQPLEAFGFEKEESAVISIVGAGGKTTIIEELAENYQRQKRRAIVTTTTHMYYPEQKWVFTESEDLMEIKDKLRQHYVVWVGQMGDHGKIKGQKAAAVLALTKEKLVVLVEADGSKRLPFKVPGEREPVLMEKTTHVIGVLGLDALHQRIAEVCFRKEMVSDFLKKAETEAIEEEDFIKVILSEQGLRKNVAKGMSYRVVLNKADTKEKEENAFRIREQLVESGVKQVYITSHLKEISF